MTDTSMTVQDKLQINQSEKLEKANTNLGGAIFLAILKLLKILELGKQKMLKFHVIKRLLRLRIYLSKLSSCNPLQTN